MNYKSILLLSALALPFAACKKAEKEDAPATTSTGSVDPAITAVFVESEPTGAVAVSEIRKSAKPGDTVTIAGKIAGAEMPFTEGFATAIVSDTALRTCDMIPGDHCPTPWDACCAGRQDIGSAVMTIQIMGDDGRPVAQSLKGANGLAELDPVVVTGTVAEGSTAENLIVNVSSLYRQNG